jgi:hypothetical protein
MEIGAETGDGECQEKNGGIRNDTRNSGGDWKGNRGPPQLPLPEVEDGLAGLRREEDERVEQ